MRVKCALLAWEALDEALTLAERKRPRTTATTAEATDRRSSAVSTRDERRETMAETETETARRPRRSCP